MNAIVNKPKIVCICGSSRFSDAFKIANMDESLRGHIVVTNGLFGHVDEPQGAQYLTSDGNSSSPAKQLLDELHFRKIDLCDEVLVINLGGYIGASTANEIRYARGHGRPVRFMFPLGGVELEVDQVVTSR